MISKKALCTLILSFLIIGNISPNVIKADDKQVIHYLNVGSSNSNGFGLHGYFTEDRYTDPIKVKYGKQLERSGYRRVADNSYPQLISKYLEDQGFEVDIDQLGQSSMRPEELRFLLDENYNPDEYTKWRFYNESDKNTWWYGQLDEVRADYKKSISEADLITYDLGTANFTIYLMNRIQSGYYSNDINYLDEEYKALYTEYVNTLKTDASLIGATNALPEDMLYTLAYAYAGFCNNFDKSIGKILELNPNAKILVIKIQNLFDGIKVSYKGTTLPLDTLYGFLIDRANDYISGRTIFHRRSPYANKYTYVSLNDSLLRPRSRVNFFIDEVINYNGDPKTLSYELIEAVDCLDFTLDLYAKFRVAYAICMANGWCSEYASSFEEHMADFVETCRNNCPEEFDEIRYSVYDALYTMFKKAATNSPLVIDDFLDGNDTRTDENNLKNGILNLLNNVLTTNIAEAFTTKNYYSDEALNAAIDDILSTDNAKFIAANGVRSTISNSFFSHPSVEGHKQIYESLLTYINYYNLVHKHNLVKHEATEMNCEHEGNIEYYECSVCHQYFEDELCNIKLSKEDVIIPIEHDLKHFDATASTYEEHGFSEYYQCLTCEKYFYDKDGKKQANSLLDFELPLKGYPVTNSNEVSPYLSSKNSYADGVASFIGADGSIEAIGQDAKTLVFYDTTNYNSEDRHSQYPKGMKVYFLEKGEDNYTASLQEGFNDILMYAGASIRVTGKKGIRIITSMPTSVKNDLVKNEYNGYKVEEYGTLMAWASKLGNNEPTLDLVGKGVAKGMAYSRSNKIYTIFKEADGVTQYTNTLVGEYSNEQCASDVAMRSYITLRPKDATDASQDITLYGGTIYRSISYVAYQNRNAFNAGSEAYEYIWSLIRAGYGNKYDSEYKGTKK